jgi:hypothetical protein
MSALESRLASLEAEVARVTQQLYETYAVILMRLDLSRLDEARLALIQATKRGAEGSTLGDPMSHAPDRTRPDVSWMTPTIWVALAELSILTGRPVRDLIQALEALMPREPAGCLPTEQQHAAQP